MHGSRALLDLASLAPRLESLLVWPDNRRVGEKLTQVIVERLPQLRLLSIDAVEGAEVFSVLTRAIEVSSSGLFSLCFWPLNCALLSATHFQWRLHPSHGAIHRRPPETIGEDTPYSSSLQDPTQASRPLPRPICEA